MNKENSFLIRPRSLVQVLYRPPFRIKPRTALFFYQHLTLAACLSTSGGYHGVCGSFFRVSIKLSKGMAARVIG